MNKRGQLTVFVVVAIVIVFSLIVYFVLRGDLLSGQVNTEIRPVYNFVQNCINQVAENSIYSIGQYGGYYIVPGLSTEEKIPYYYDRGRSLYPSKLQVERELGKYLEYELFFCLENFVAFSDFEVNLGEINSEVVVNSGKVLFNVDFPLSIKKDDRSFFIDSFNTEVDSRLYTVYEVASAIAVEQFRSKDICISCISDLAFEKQVFVLINQHPFEENVILFNLRDDQMKINGEDYNFYFAHRYDE